MVRSDDFALLIGRLAVAALFLPSGFGKLIGFSGFAAAAMAAFSVMAAFLSRRYWTMPDAAAAANRIHFYKDLAIAGGFLFLHVAGGGRFGVDGRRSAAPAGARA